MPDVSRAGAWARLIVRPLIGLAAALAVSAPALAQPPMWTVKGPKGVVVLFGSVHLLPPGLDWRPRALEDALNKASDIWFELPITQDTDNEASALSLKRGQLPAGASLSDMLTPYDVAKLQRAAVKVHCVPETLLRMQPWLAEVTLSVAEDALSGANAFNGVEEQVQAVAPIETPRRSFETAREQIGFLAGAAEKDQVASLVWTLHEIDDDPATYERVVREWMDQDLAGIEHDAIAPLRTASPGLYQRLIVERNRRWAAMLRRRLKAPGLAVVVVGVGHLVGPDGLPSLLRAEGFQVQGP
jgi:uncharacterized protein YbaP (TraB family)